MGIESGDLYRWRQRPSNFYRETEEYFGGDGPACPAGVSHGPISAPNAAHATAPGQTTYQHGGWLYPGTYDTEFNGQNRCVDVEVKRSAASLVNPSSFLSFFP